MSFVANDILIFSIYVFKAICKKINLILITHGFGKQTQFIESLLDGHSKIIQFPTNYKDYFLNLTSKNYIDAIDEFIYQNLVMCMMFLTFIKINI